MVVAVSNLDTYVPKNSSSWLDNSLSRWGQRGMLTVFQAKSHDLHMTSPVDLLIDRRGHIRPSLQCRVLFHKQSNTDVEEKNEDHQDTNGQHYQTILCWGHSTS